MLDGQKLLVACIKDGDQRLLSAINKKWLEGVELRQYSFVMDYYRDNGELVGLKTFCDKYKLDSKEVDSKPQYYYEVVKERYLYASMAENIPKILRDLKVNPKEKLGDLQTLIAGLAVEAVESRDTLYSDDTSARKDEYEERIKSKGVTYLSMGNEYMDSAFYGYRRQDLITIGGKAGQGKTWLLIYLCYLLEGVIESKTTEGVEFGDILFISNEMDSAEIKDRIDCIKFKLPYSDFLAGSLNKRDKSRYYRGLRRLSKGKSKIRIVYNCQTIDELTTLAGIYRPSAIFIDGSYIMEGKMQEGWEKIVYITRNLKRIARNFSIPIINTTQLKRGSAKSSSKVSLDGQDDFAYSSSYSQDSDIAIRMYQDADMKYHEKVGCEVVKGRRVVSGTKVEFTNNLATMDLGITIPEEDNYEPEIKKDI